MTFSPNTIHREDCVAALGQLPEESVDLAFADPPFNIGYEYDVYDDAQDAQSYLSWSRNWLTAVHRVLKPNGAFWLAIGDDYAAELKVLSQEIGFHCRSWVIWYYTFGVNCKKKFNRSHVHLFHFVMNPKEFTFNRQSIAVPSARQLVYADSRANPAGRLPDDTWILRPQDCASGFTPDEDTWYFPRVAGTFKERAGFHGCQMPEQLLGRIIKVSSHKGDLVLDPFSGSATTLAVAKKLGRAYLGFEISEEYVTRGLSRLDAIQPGDPLDGAPEPLVSAPSTEGKSKQGTSKQAKLKPANGTTVSPQRPPGRLRQETDEERGVIEAFRKTYDGFSVDRVVADRNRNANFLSQCEKHGITGTAAELNRTLFRLRKAGRLVSVPTYRRTTFDWEECDPFLDASEIALSQMLASGCPTLDEMLCDPDTAAEFDRIAMKFAPGHSSLQYRWAALKLRKAAKTARVRSETIGDISLSREKQIPIDELESAGIASEPGIYLVYSGQRKVLFVGVSLDLQKRLNRAFGTPEIAAAWKDAGTSLRVKFRALGQLSPSGAQATPHLLAHKTRLVTDKNPALNLTTPAAV